MDTQGDAFFFSFARARDAVEAAVAAQRALRDHAWPGGAQVRVRMGLHTGEPSVGDEGYIGLDVVRAARICSAGHGGQILVSETTRALLGNQLPEGASVLDLGEAHLKDIQHEHVYQLSIDDGAASFPPLKTEPTAKTEDWGAALARRIQEQVQQDIERSFSSGRAPQASSRLRVGRARQPRAARGGHRRHRAAREARVLTARVEAWTRRASCSSRRPRWPRTSSPRSTSGRYFRRWTPMICAPRSAGRCPTSRRDPRDVIAQLRAGAEPGVVAIPSGRYFGFVIGGSVPAALAADWLTSTWDQNAGLYAAGPSAAVVEEIAGGWLRELLGIPAHASFAFVTGCQMANFTALAAARLHVLAESGWDVNRDGLAGAPRVRVIVGAKVHVTVIRALRLLGLGAPVVVPADTQGRMIVEELREALAGGDGPTIVCAQAGEVNTGSFDPLPEIADAARAAGAWLHVDGAFGLWAAASPSPGAPRRRRRAARTRGRPTRTSGSTSPTTPESRSAPIPTRTAPRSARRPST